MYSTNSGSTDPKKKGPALRRPLLTSSTTRYESGQAVSGSVVVVVAVAIVVVVPIVGDMVDVDTDTAVGAAANLLAHGRRIAAGADYPDRRRLRDEDEIALGVGRRRVRAGRLRDGFDQDAGRIDHTEHRRLGR